MAADGRSAPSLRPDRDDPLAELLLLAGPNDLAAGEAALSLEQVHAEDRAALETLFAHLRAQPEPTVARLDVRVRSAGEGWSLREAVVSNLLAGNRIAGKAPGSIHLQWREAERRGLAPCSCGADDRLQMIAEASEDIIGVADGQRQTLYVSPALARITGYTLDEIQSSDFSCRVHPADGPLVELARDLNLRGQGTRIEYRYRCKSGEYIWLESQAAPVVSAGGSIERIVLTTREITLRKAAEQGLRRLEASWRSLVESAADVVELLDATGTILFANRPRPGRLLTESVGCPLTRGLAPETSRALWAALHAALAGGETVDVEWEWSPNGQPPIWYWTRISPLATAGRAERVVAISRDVTARRRQAQQAQTLAPAVRATAQQLAQQLTASLDRLAAAEPALAPHSAAGGALAQAQGTLRSALALAGRLAELAEPPADEEPPVPAAAEPAAPLPPASILLVDDDDSVRASLLALLRARGVRVAAAADGQSALDLYQERAHEIDAVVLDQNMPAMNGTSVLRELRAIRPDVKVVISSGDLLETWDAPIDECNRLAFAQKALGPQELLAQLQRLLQRKL